MDYRAMYDGTYLGAWNLVDEQGNKKDKTLTIADVKAGQVTMEGGVKNKKPLVTFHGVPLPFVVCKTNAKTIAAMYGNNTSNWVGKRITLFATTTQVGGQEKDCIRIRPRIPEGKEAANAPAQA